MSVNDCKLTQERLREVFDYIPETGDLVWKIRKGKAIPGKLAGWMHKTAGYMETCIDGHRHFNHRMIWLYFHGKFPDGEIDHINRIRTDNRIENLRDVTKATNQQNKMRAAATYRRTSLYIGVHWCKNMKSFSAMINRNGVKHRLGYFEFAEDAAIAYLQAKKHLDGGTKYPLPPPKI